MGTLDVSVLNISEGVFEVRSTNGDTHLGGEDIDNILVNYVANEFNKKYNTDMTKDFRAMRRLRSHCEHGKISLSSVNKITIDVDSLYQGKDFTIDITRAKLEALCDNLFKRIYLPMDNAIRDAKLDKSKIDEVVLVGGSSRIPKIQEMLKSYFNGKELCKSINPDECVAIGAAIQGAILSGVQTEEIKDLLLLDIVSLTLGVEEHGYNMAPIIKRNTPIPVKRSEIFSTGSDCQTCVRIRIFEGERPLTKDNHLLGEFELAGITPLPRGVPQIEIEYDVDANGILQVTACEKQSNKKKSITINRNNSGLTKEEVDKMVDEAKDHEKDDNELRDKLEAKGKLEGLCYSLKTGITQLKIENPDKETIEKKIKEIQDKLEDRENKFTKEEYKEMFDELNTIAMPIMTTAYQKSNKSTPSTQSEVSKPAYVSEEENNIPQVKTTTQPKIQNKNNVKIEEID